MGNNQSKMDALNSQMNLLVETQAEEIKTLKFSVDALDKQATHYCLLSEELKEQNK
jgi:hypothetical protein